MSFTQSFSRGSSSNGARTGEHNIARNIAHGKCNHGKRNHGKLGANIAALIFVIIWIFPTYWMLKTAITPQQELLSTNPTLLPSWSSGMGSANSSTSTHGISFANFATVLHSRHFFTYLLNSSIVTLISVLMSIAVATMACAALTLYKFKHQSVSLGLLFVVQMIPSTALLIPQFIVFNRFGLLDKFAGLILAYTATVLPLAIWNLRNFFLTLPKSTFEAARIDGASEWKLLWKIVFPLAAPGVISTSVIAFVRAWNDYIVAFTVMKTQSNYTLPIWLATFSTPSGIDVGAQMAGSLLFSLPVVLFFMIIQTRLVQRDTIGSEK